MRPEVVAPVGNAVSLVDHQQRDAAGVPGQHFRSEAFIGEALRGDQENIDLVAGEFVFGFGPFARVVGIDRGSAHAHSLGGGNLVAHQRQKRRNQQRRAAAGLTQQFGGNEVNKTLAPSGLLHDQ